MLPLLLVVPNVGGALFAPPAARLFDTVERGLFSAEREREGLLRRVRQRAFGDRLSQLTPADHAIAAGSTVVVTGASDGIGREAAVLLAREGFGTVLCVRDAEKGEAAARYVRAMASASARVEVVELDLASFASVEAGAARVEAAVAAIGAPVRGLLCNAGAWPTERRLTADGLECGWQTNHVGHFQLTAKLLPLLKAGLAPSDEARVVVVSSSAHAIPSRATVSDPAWVERRWDATEAYGQGKLCATHALEPHCMRAIACASFACAGERRRVSHLARNHRVTTI